MFRPCTTLLTRNVTSAIWNWAPFYIDTVKRVMDGTWKSEKYWGGWKDGIVPLDGLVETDWLPFTFTMNWRFTRRKTIRFEKGEPFCFVTLFPHGLIDEVAPRLADLSDDPPLKAGQYANAGSPRRHRPRACGSAQQAAHRWPE